MLALKNFRPLFLIVVFLALFILPTMASAASKFTFVVLPDTQFYSSSYTDIFTKQTQWIVDNKKALNIKYVIHVGDIVDSPNNLTQWKNADKALSVLDRAKIPYGVTAGNHDNNNGISNANYSKYFNTSRFSKKNWFGKAYNKNNAYHYDLIRAGNYSFIIMYVSYDQSADVPISWIKNVIKTNPEKQVIIVTHALLDGNGNILSSPNSVNAIRSLASEHKNVIMVLSGHMPISPYKIVHNVRGNAHEILQDYQNEPKGGDGWLRIFTFDGNGKVVVQTYSPYLNKYGASFSFTLPQVSTPKFSLSTGSYTGSKKVSVTTTTSGDIIRYTLDGKTPTITSPKYTGKITIPAKKTTILKAKAWKLGMITSDTTTAKYIIK